MIFRFAQPEFLWLLALIPVFLLMRGKAGRKAAVRFPSIQLAKQVAAFTRSRPGRFSGWLRALVLIFLILALARPQSGEENVTISESGIDIMLTVDLSTSMWAHDFIIAGARVDRLTAVKSVLDDFIEARAGDRLGLIAFAGEAYLVSPLTLNHDWVIQRLDDLRIGGVTDGTAIGNAIGASINRLVDVESENKVIVLLTDGANNRGVIDPIPAARAAAALGIRVYTVGVGQLGNAPFPRLDRTGQPIRTADGNMVFATARADIDLELLQEIAAITGGHYFHATNQSELETVYDQINELEKTEVSYELRRHYADIFWIPLAAGIVFLLVEQLLAQTRFRRLP